ncbi:subfamily B ATP-binding cassette protein MsbA [Elusimicrobium posterum]|uniref:ABC transporter ATP-binding protein n=1 Tax=Elusimicrobium posterum TaxID=3116653 RepID=UPI003C73A907
MLKTDLKEKIKTATLNSGLIKNYSRMWPFVKPYWFRALIGVALTIPVGSLDAAIALFLKPLMDNVMVEKQPEFSKMLPFIIVGFTIIQGILNYAAAYINTWVGNKITIGIKRKLFDKLLSMDSAYFDRSNSGQIMLRYSNDADMASSGLVNNLKMFLSKFFSSLALVGVLVWNSWQLAILAVGVLVFAFYPMSIVRKKIKDIAHRAVGAGSQIMTLYNEVFAGNRVVHSFTLEDAMKDKFNNTTDRIFTLAIKMVQGSNWLSPVMHLISSLGVALVIGAGSYLIVHGEITSGNFVSFIAALLMLYTPLKSIGNNYVEIQRSFLAIERIFDIFNIEPKIKDIDNPKELKEIKTGISFENVHFRYKKDKEVLHGINLDIPIGKTVALVGNSGGGKTTIAALIPRLYDVQKGAIKIDGVNIKEFSKKSLRSNISMVFQDNILFSGSIKDNIVLANPSVSEEGIWAALKNACLDEFVKDLQDQLNTEIGERGILLSGGQKQRLAIARAFVKDAPIVILDEATSALDNKSEAVVQQALDNLMKNRTVIVIAHRLSTVQNADKIVVLMEGNIAEQGKHHDLLNIENGVYQTLHKTQFKKQ